VQDGETGWLNRSASAEGLARHMADAIEDPRRVLEMHRRVVERREQLVRPMAAHVAEVEGVYRSVA
jgi:hypothetical protein